MRLMSKTVQRVPPMNGTRWENRIILGCWAVSSKDTANPFVKLTSRRRSIYLYAMITFQAFRLQISASPSHTRVNSLPFPTYRLTCSRLHLYLLSATNSYVTSEHESVKYIHGLSMTRKIWTGAYARTWMELSRMIPRSTWKSAPDLTRRRHLRHGPPWFLYIFLGSIFSPGFLDSSSG